MSTKGSGGAKYKAGFKNPNKKNANDNSVKNVIEHSNCPPKPQLRKFDSSGMPKELWTGTYINLTSLNLWVSGVGDLDFQCGEYVLPGANAIAIEAYGDKNWEGCWFNGAVTGVRPKVPLNWNVKPVWKMHEQVTIKTVSAWADLSMIYKPGFDPIIQIIEPVGGNFAAPTDKATVKIKIVQDNYFAEVVKTTTVKVEKETAVIQWDKPLPVVKDSLLGDGQLNATTSPRTQPGKQPVLKYSPELKTKMTKLGDVTLKASFSGNTWFNAAADKTVTIKVVEDLKTVGVEAMRSGQAWIGPTTNAQKSLLNAWNSDNSETGIRKQAQKIMSEVQGLTGDELEEYMDRFINPTGSSAIGRKNPPSGNPRNIIWDFDNGLQVRYKPDGDGKTDNPMFCVEGKICAGPSEHKWQVAFKVTLDGQPGAYGPKQTKLPPGISSNKYDSSNKEYMNGACGTTHLQCKPKVEQTISWSDPESLTVGEKLGKWLNAKAQDTSALEYTNAKDEVIDENTILPVGNDQVLKVKGKATKRYKASATPVTVKITVNKKKQTLTWPQPTGEIFVGDKLDGVLKASSNDPKASIRYYEKDTEITVDSALTAGPHKLTAQSAASETYEKAEAVSVDIIVKKRVQTLDWPQPTGEIFVGDKLDGVLKASSNDPKASIRYYEKDTEITADSALTAGPHKLTAQSAASETYEKAEAVSVDIIVKKRVQTLDWQQPTGEIFVGDKLDGVLKASSNDPKASIRYYEKDTEITADSALTAGPHKLTAQSAASETYEKAEAVSVDIIVKKRVQTLDWQQPTGEIFVGDKLDGVLKASSNDPKASIRYYEKDTEITVDSALTAGPHKLTAQSAASETYEKAEAVSVDIIVKKRVQTLDWQQPTGEIFVGDKLDGVLKASSNDPKASIRYYEKDTEITTDSALTAGPHKLTAQSAASETYEKAEAVSVDIIVKKRVQTLDWQQPTGEIFVGDKLDGVLKASSNDPKASIRYYEKDTEITVDSALTAGPHKLTAQSAASETYEKAEAVSVDIIVKKRVQTLDWPQPTGEIFVGDKLDGVLKASSNDPKASIRYYEKDTEITVDSALTAGPHKLTARSAGNDTYEQAEPVSIEIVIKPVEEKK